MSAVAEASSVPFATPPAVVARGYRRRDAVVRRSLAAADVAAVLLAFLLVLAPGQGRRATLAGLLGVAAWPLLLRAYGLYEADIKRLTRGAPRDLPGVVHATLVGSVLYWAYAHATLMRVPGVGTLLTFAAVTVAGMLVLRMLARLVLQRVLGPERAVIAGDPASIRLLAGKLRAHSEYGVELVGALGGQETSRLGLRMLGGGSELDLAAVAARHRIDRVILAGTDALDGTLGDQVRCAHRLGLKVDYLPHPLEVIGAGVEVDDIEGVTVYALYPPVLCRSSRWLKRAIDIVGALVLLVLAAPLMALIAAAVKLDSRGPVLFRQHRIGRGGRRLTIAKFRTMTTGAEALTDELRERSRDPHWLLLDADPRITRVGRQLRARSLDELPQLWSVLKGDMSLVGPRPLVEHEDRQITGWRRGRLDLTPGLTGLWQVLGRTCIPFEEMVKLDYIYVTTWSAWRDVQLLLRTLGVVLFARGAN